MRTLPRSSTVACALLSSAALALPSAALAMAGDASFARTYPYASALCTRVGEGRVSSVLQRNAAAVLGDCGSLQSSFTEAQTAVLAARASILPQIASDRGALSSACAGVPGTPAVCRATRTAERPALAALRAQLRAALLAYRSAIEAGRVSFRTALQTDRAEPASAVAPKEPAAPRAPAPTPAPTPQT